MFCCGYNDRKARNCMKPERFFFFSFTSLFEIYFLIKQVSLALLPPTPLPCAYSVNGSNLLHFIAVEFNGKGLPKKTCEQGCITVDTTQ